MKIRSNKTVRRTIAAYKAGCTVTPNGDVFDIDKGYRNISTTSNGGGVGHKDTHYRKRFFFQDGHVYVHQLAAYQLFGKLAFAPGIEVRHLNNNSLDNRLSNISIGTAEQNAQDKKRSTIDISAPF